jgi:hypothetical protein
MINIEIDALINSIQDRLTGEIFETDVLNANLDEIKILQGWNFDWQKEFHNCKVYKLVLLNEPSIIQGLISLQIRRGFIYASLMESAPSNFGKDKRFIGIAGNLVAFACKLSFELGNEGYVNFVAKTALIKHYKLTLNATVISGQNMMIETQSAINLVNRYFKDFKIP